MSYARKWAEAERALERWSRAAARLAEFVRWTGAGSRDEPGAEDLLGALDDGDLDGLEDALQSWVEDRCVHDWRDEGCGGSEWWCPKCGGRRKP